LDSKAEDEGELVERLGEHGSNGGLSRSLRTVGRSTTIASASLTAVWGQILNTVGSAAASARSRLANVDGDPIVDRHQDDDVGPSVAANIQSRVTPGIPCERCANGSVASVPPFGKVSSGPGLVDGGAGGC
jgi:hypothetical protein